MNYWLLKSEPETFPWQQVKDERRVMWNEIRNYQARKYISLMNIGDLCFFYHSGKNPSIVGVAQVASKHYPDPLDFRFLAIDIQYHSDLSRFMTLKEIKNHQSLANMLIIKQSRLSVSPVTREEYDIIFSFSIANVQ